MSVTTHIARGPGSASVVTLRDPEHEELEIVFTFVRAHGGWQLTELRLVQSIPSADDGGLKASALRDLPFVRWQRAARASVVQSAHQEVIGWFADQESAVHALGIEKLRWGQLEEDPTLMRQFVQTKKLASVARLYRRQVAAGRRDPAAEVARELEMKPSTARSWIYRARRAGLLEPSGRAARLENELETP